MSTNLFLVTPSVREGSRAQKEWETGFFSKLTGPDFKVIRQNQL
jgi:hypothetical protein